jgi:hypothetical protein
LLSVSDAADSLRVIEAYQFLLMTEDALRIFIRDAPAREDTREQSLTKLAIQESFDRVRRKFSNYRWTISPWTNATVDELYTEVVSVFRTIINYQFSIR